MASKKPFISIDMTEFEQSLKKVVGKLRNAGRQVEKAVTLATSQFADHTLGIAQGKAPIDEGGLRGSATLEDPVKEGGAVVVYCGFNKEYARIQDVGGTIRPVRAKMLFIPLRKGVYPVKDKAARKAAGFVQGKDFVLAREVTLKGNRYWSSTIEEQQVLATKAIGQQAIKLLGRAFA